MKNLEITYEELSCISVKILLEQFSNCTSGSRGALGVERGASRWSGLTAFLLLCLNHNRVTFVYFMLGLLRETLIRVHS